MRTSPPTRPYWTSAFSRIFRQGDSLVLLNSHHIFVISRPLATGEIEALNWAQAQDEAALIDVVALPDGRDFIVLEREHSRQTRGEALAEEADHLLSLLRNEVEIVRQAGDVTRRKAT